MCIVADDHFMTLLAKLSFDKKQVGTQPIKIPRANTIVKKRPELYQPGPFNLPEWSELVVCEG